MNKVTSFGFDNNRPKRPIIVHLSTSIWNRIHADKDQLKQQEARRATLVHSSSSIWKGT